LVARFANVHFLGSTHSGKYVTITIKLGESKNRGTKLKTGIIKRNRERESYSKREE